MTRRDFVWTVAVAAAANSAATPAANSASAPGANSTVAPGANSTAKAPLIVPVHQVMDSRAKCTPEQLHRFFSTIWPETIRDFSRCGIQLQKSEVTGEIRRSPGDWPVFAGLERGVVNLVLTDHIPMKWDSGRSLAGVTTLYQGYHLCVVALQYAHGHQVPYLSTNTCMHEMLHALLQDIFVNRPKWFQAGGRELRVDWYATRLWLFHDGDPIRKSAQVYLGRLRSDAASRPVSG